MSTGLMDVRDVSTIFGVADRPEALILNDSRKPEDGVQRCPQLMAHFGEELGFGAIGDLGILLGAQ